MKHLRKAGTLDPDFGEQGQAAIPAPGADPDSRTLQGNVAVGDGNGAVVVQGYAASAEDDRQQLFVRASPDGKRWSEPVAVRVPPSGAFDVDPFQAICAAPAGYLAAAGAWWFTDDGRAFHDYAVARVGSDFKPWPGFGNEGFAFLDGLREPAVFMHRKPEGFEFTVPASNLRAGELPDPAGARMLGYRGLPGLFADEPNGRLLMMFDDWVYASDGTFTNTLSIASLDLATGEPLATLGDPQAPVAKIALLPPTNSETSSIIRILFIEKGGLLLLAAPQSGASDWVTLRRFDGRGLPVSSFGDDGMVRFPAMRSPFFGLELAGGRILVSNGSGLVRTDPTFVWAYDLQGQVDPTFNAGKRLDISPVIPDSLGIALDHIAVDASGRILLGGAQFISPLIPGQYIEQRAVVFRLHPDGAVDLEFGHDGYFLSDSYQTTVNQLFITGDEIRFSSVLPTGDALFYETLIKLLA